MDVPSCLFADPASVECLDLVVDEVAHVITLRMKTTPTTAACPKCCCLSGRVHSRYVRTLADLPWAGVPVRISLTARRFACENPACDQWIFVERLPRFAKPWGRRTQRLAHVQQQLGGYAGASCGVRLCATLGMSASIDVLLSLIRHADGPTTGTLPLRVIGVDDWAKRKGQSYGTLIVDHERGAVVDVLPDRTPETLAVWLRAHPGIEVVSRDRAEAYAQGIREGAPSAIQVADRWHLLKNLTDALFRVLQQHHQVIAARLKPEQPACQSACEVEAVTAACAEQPTVATTVDIVDTAATVTEANTLVSSVSSALPVPVPVPVPVQSLQQAQLVQPTLAEQRRWARMQQTHHLHQEGWNQHAIAAHLNIHPKSVSRYLSAPLQPAPRRASRMSILEPYKVYLTERWAAGCHNASRLMTEVVARGYSGRRTLVCDFVHRLKLRQAAEVTISTSDEQKRNMTVIPAERAPTLRCLAWCVTQPADKLSAEQAKALTAITGANAKLDAAIDLGRQFARLVHDRVPDQLDAWLDKATASGISVLRSFAQGIRRDYAAVFNALKLPWSNGRTEGHVNRLKCLKRTMYGRAKLDLLRQRLLMT